MIDIKNLEKISINDLPKYTPWVERLLGLKDFTKPVRDLAKIDAEYDKDKYAKLLTYYKKHPDVSAIDIMMEGFLLKNDVLCISRKGELFVTNLANFLKLQDDVLVKALEESINKVSAVVELGCGFGYNFSVLRNAFPNRLWLGGEYSKNAIELANLLFTDFEDVSVKPFNWYENTWAILENLEEKALIFTRHSIEQLPKVKSVVPTFNKYRGKIEEVIHLEPVYELVDKRSTLGLMRRAYTSMNDYNTDLLTTLKHMNVKILETDTDIIGGNPLNPTSLIRWKFAGD